MIRSEAFNQATKSIATEGKARAFDERSMSKAQDPNHHPILVAKIRKVVLMNKITETNIENEHRKMTRNCVDELRKVLAVFSILVSLVTVGVEFGQPGSLG
jgi:hypothetical protein